MIDEITKLCVAKTAEVLFLIAAFANLISNELRKALMHFGLAIICILIMIWH